MDGMCRMMGGMMCGRWGVLVLLLVVVILALVVAIVALARRSGPRPPVPPG